MTHSFKHIDYLKHGNKRQKIAYYEIKKYQVYDKLKNYDPIVTGTIPIAIDLPESDLDIICQCQDHKAFSKHLQEQFGDQNEFKLATISQNGVLATIASFSTPHFEFEIFGQNVPVEKQNAYRHMLIEHLILQQKGSEFRKAIVELKASGLKTEPAFAKLLGLPGNAYEELLKLNLASF
ncbi:DUF4269 domain-containing protein [Maribacter thermophilus]|uniref:DUF4269 domain-containing protein n=1 Tax=Maribacter thermophilus TaxID=1197874 RepID=UPI00069A5408|nr:DUF4269 domain-containing protein [Maribacter thermophilus]